MTRMANNYGVFLSIDQKSRTTLGSVSVFFTGYLHDKLQSDELIFFLFNLHLDNPLFQYFNEKGSNLFESGKSSCHNTGNNHGYINAELSAAFYAYYTRTVRFANDFCYLRYFWLTGTPLAFLS